MRRICLIMLILGSSGWFAQAQRTWQPHSVLQSGNWYKFSVPGPGIYKIDLAFLKTLGISSGNINSSEIRIFGNGGAMLGEAAGSKNPDDLIENALMVFDGGDGNFNGADYLLFYAPGPDSWIKDSINRRFVFRKNLYADQSVYFLSIGGAGKRIGTMQQNFSANTFVSGYSIRYAMEKDSINFLSSGKNWYGDEFANAPGKLTARSYPVNLSAADSTQPFTLHLSAVARSIGTASRFSASSGGSEIVAMDIAPTGAGNYDAFAISQEAIGNFNITGSAFTLDLSFTPGSFNAQGWLDRIEISGRGWLNMAGTDMLFFRDWNSVSPGNTGQFTIQSFPSGQLWDITDPLQPSAVKGTQNGNDFQFVNDCSTLHEYVAFNGNAYALPKAIGKADNQDLHGAPQADLLVVSPPLLIPEARRLAQFHAQQDQLSIAVVSTDQVYNEFASGSPDPASIRDFVKMYYDRAGTDSTRRPKYLLLFGAASYDYKNRLKQNTNLVPAFESSESLSPLSTYVTDDFFGLLDNNDDINAQINVPLLDIGTGRIPARNLNEAKAVVDKIIHYTDPKTQGPWRNELTFIADDNDNNLHLNDAEIFTATAAGVAPVYHINKIYLDAYKLTSTPAGARYPDVNLAISNQVYNGTFIWNFNGHGSFTRLSEEDILDQPIINSFNNPDKLTLFITATCDFTPYDNPLINPIGSNLLLRNSTGAIALMTTTRLVFAYSNRIINNNYLQVLLQPKADGSFLTLGEAGKLAKNLTYQTLGDPVNNRKFTLIGDPSLRLAFPALKVKPTQINGRTIGTVPDTLAALNKYALSGIITDKNGVAQPTYNGTVYATIFDKPRTVSTLGNQPGSIKAPFQVQDNIIYKGKADIVNGNFSLSFVVPKDINYQFGKGKMSLYAADGHQDGNGIFTDFLVGGSSTAAINDKDGPVIKAFLNDENFINGGITNDAPVLIVKLTDSSGINIIGNGIGHDISAILDNDIKNPFVLNKYYEGDINSFQKGTVRFQMPSVAEGGHTLNIKAWDVADNSAQTILQFRVVQKSSIELNHVLNYPNPFTTHTNFWFDHNRPGEDLQVFIQIFTVTGKLVKTIRRTINSPGNRSNEIDWDGKDDFGSKIGRGVYIYSLRVHSADGKSAQKLEKLLIL